MLPDYDPNPYLSGSSVNRAEVLRPGDLRHASDEAVQVAVNQLHAAVARLKLEHEFHSLFRDWLRLMESREDH